LYLGIIVHMVAAKKSATYSEVSKPSVFERLAPVFVLLSLVLAFLVGTLWQKVQTLEGQQVGVGSGAGNPTVPQGGQPGPGDVAGKLSNLEAVAASVGIDVGEFKSCVDSKKYAGKVDEQYKAGGAAGVTGTPGNFILNSRGEAWLVPGAVPYATLKPIIEAALGNSTYTEGKLTAEQIARIPKVSAADHVRGSRSAQVFLIEYSDFQCSFCARFHPTAKQLVDEYQNVAWVYRHFPLDAIHPLARPTAEASECVAELGGNDAFWEFTDAIFEG
jgi:protein-disulfide isomerase